jgi:hypothetical protein
MLQRTSGLPNRPATSVEAGCLAIPKALKYGGAAYGLLDAGRGTRWRGTSSRTAPASPCYAVIEHEDAAVADQAVARDSSKANTGGCHV